MAQIILDFGSGNTSKNDISYCINMLEQLDYYDSRRHEVIIKWQLFKKAGNNIPLRHSVFRQVYNVAQSLGYKTTASVFDKESLEFLLDFDIPFVKIANNRELDYLIGEVPREIPVYVSKNSKTKFNAETRCYICQDEFDRLKILHCISDYPADISAYLEDDYDELYDGISDHTTNWDLYNKYKPEIYECHYVLEHDSNNPDGGLFARTPKMLKEIL